LRQTEVNEMPTSTKQLSKDGDTTTYEVTHNGQVIGRIESETIREHRNFGSKRYGYDRQPRRVYRIVGQYTPFDRKGDAVAVLVAEAR
jgi:hypothetical protein